MIALVVVLVRLVRAAAGYATWRIERSLAMSNERGICGECGSEHFLIGNLTNPDIEGTVIIDPDGRIVEAYGLLFCAGCGELFEPRQTRVERPSRPNLTIVGEEKSGA